MIFTPNIVINNEHQNAFQDEFAKYNSTEGDVTKHWGTGELETLDVVVKKIRTPQGKGMYVIISDGNEGILICRLIAAPVPQGALPWGRKIYTMDSIRVHADYVGRGLAPAVYRWLADHGYTILSDSHQTQTSLAVWRKLAATEKVYTINIDEGTWRPYDPLRVEDWMLFGNNDLVKYWPIRFILPAN